MKKFLVVVDMQNDFVDGSLGTPEAVAIVKNVVGKIDEKWDHIYVTYDTHSEEYMDTLEGKHLPVKHCVKGTEGWKLTSDVEQAVQKAEKENNNVTRVEKYTFGAANLPGLIKEQAGSEDYDVTLIGLCTDICVISNALLIKANDCEKEIYVVENCTAGVTPETKDAALVTMRSCQINVI